MFVYESGQASPVKRQRALRVSFDQKCINTCRLFEKDGGSGAFMAHLTDPANEAMHDFAAGFYSSSHLETILTHCYAKSESVRVRIDEWYEAQSHERLKRKISKELDALKDALLFEMKDVTAAYLLDFTLEEKIFPLLEKYAPFTRDLIIRAVQTDRAANENIIKLPEIVRSYHY